MSVFIRGQRTIPHLRLSAQPQALSKPFLLPVFVLSHDGRMAVTFCIAARSYRGNGWCSEARIQPVRGFVGGRGKGAGDDADYARMRRRLAVPLSSNIRRVRRFTFSTLQLRGLMGEPELMVARRDKESGGLSARESVLISETDQLSQAPAK
jgi:hypothetical protein